MITGSVQKSEKPLSFCSLPPAPCGLNDKFLTGHDMTRRTHVKLTRDSKVQISEHVFDEEN